MSIVDSPWAKDADGKDVETYFTTDGKTLTQVVKHNVAGVVYPVTADPWWTRSCINYIASSFTSSYNGKVRLNTRPTRCGRAFAQFNSIHIEVIMMQCIEQEYGRLVMNIGLCIINGFVTLNGEW